MKGASSSRVTDNQLLISSFPAFARLITSFCAVKFLSSGMSSFPLCKRTEEIIYPAGICKVQLTCNANRKMEIDRSSFSFFGETMQNKTDMTNLARSDNRLLDHLLILDFGTPLREMSLFYASFALILGISTLFMSMSST